ncbi:Small GTPase superfamily [Trinorchestia longiramus]|nr:Small GTPase superfamily [Trinorchestia longiramus]
MSSPKTSLTALSKLSSLYRARPIRLLVLGQAGVGKSAMVVRFLTKRFIGEYSPQQEGVYSHTVDFASSQVHLEILDAAGDEKKKLVLDIHHNTPALQHHSAECCVPVLLGVVK